MFGVFVNRSEMINYEIISEKMNIKHHKLLFNWMFLFLTSGCCSVGSHGFGGLVLFLGVFPGGQGGSLPSSLFPPSEWGGVSCPSWLGSLSWHCGQTGGVPLPLPPHPPQSGVAFTAASSSNTAAPHWLIQDQPHCSQLNGTSKYTPPPSPPSGHRTLDPPRSAGLKEWRVLSSRCRGNKNKQISRWWQSSSLYLISLNGYIKG